MQDKFKNILKQNIGSTQIGNFKFSYRNNDIGGTHYKQKLHIEEYYNPLYSLIRQKISPKICIDVGANYGLTGLIMRKQFPESRLVLVEPIPWLQDFINYNFAINDSNYDEFHSKICSSEASQVDVIFGVNEKSSQDSRVIPQKGYKEINTESITLSDLLGGVETNEGVYIKIDTQGWEENVFKGGQSFLDKHSNWFVKTEFAPKWMISQGTNPVEFLKWLISKFNVYESLGRVQWNSSNLSKALGEPLKVGCEDVFTDYITNLANHKLGWVDLYVRPKEK